MEINILQIHAPTSQSEDNEVEAFYEEIDKVLRYVNKHEVIIIMGDLNAKISKRKWEGLIGERNERRERLVQFVQQKGMDTEKTRTMEKLHRKFISW